MALIDSTYFRRTEPDTGMTDGEWTREAIKLGLVRLATNDKKLKRAAPPPEPAEAAQPQPVYTEERRPSSYLEETLHENRVTADNVKPPPRRRRQKRKTATVSRDTDLRETAAKLLKGD